MANFLTAADGEPAFDEGTHFLRALLTAAKPLVAAVQGRAIGIGMTLLLHCDHVVLASDALLSAPFASLALVPEAGSSLLLPARIGHVRAFAVFALGEAISADDAVAWGLANKVVPNEALLDSAHAAACLLATLPPAALKTTKALLRDIPALSKRIDLELDHFLRSVASPAARETFSAFVKRSSPDFSRVS
jgi:enoyl-CoA hydratase/carnithine racemase